MIFYFFAIKGLNIIAIEDASHTNSEYTLKRPFMEKKTKKYVALLASHESTNSSSVFVEF